MIVKTKCQHCGNGLEFDASQDGQLAECPHCLQQTILLVQRASAQVLAPPPQVPKAIADSRPLPASEQGVVQALEVFGLIYLIAGIFGGIGALLAAAANSDRDSMNPTSIWLVALGLGVIFQSILIKYLLDGFAELIRKVRIIADKP